MAVGLRNARGYHPNRWRDGRHRPLVNDSGLIGIFSWLSERGDEHLSDGVPIKPVSLSL